MTLTHAEQHFLGRQDRGYLATIGPEGTPQVKPLGFRYNPATGTIDIAGFNMGSSAKFRNVQRNAKVAFVVDEVTARSMEGTHFLEVRGVAETVVAAPEAPGQRGSEIIRIHPQRVICFNIDPAAPGLHTRDVPAAGAP